MSRLQAQNTYDVLGEEYNASSDDDYYYRVTYRVVKWCGRDHVSFDIEVVEEGNVEYNSESYGEIVPARTSFPDKEKALRLFVHGKFHH